MRRGAWLCLIALAALCGCRTSPEPRVATPPRVLEEMPRQPSTPGVKTDVPYVTTPEPVMEVMFQLAQVKQGEMVYDLGCGDGRIVVAAAKEYGARGVGVDIDPARIRESNENARKAGVSDRVRFTQQDLFTMEFRDADVIALYLLPELNLRLRPRLLGELRPGTRIVSHDFHMADWEPDRKVDVREGRGHTVYFWVIPAKVAGAWHWSVTGSTGGPRQTAELAQKFQKVSGGVTQEGRTIPLTEARLTGDQLSFSLAREEQGQRVTTRFRGRVSGDRIQGTLEQVGGAHPGRYDWTATRTGGHSRAADQP